MVNQILMCLVGCIIYPGLLGISYVVNDPFGDDILDFPVVAYTEYVSWSCTAFERAANNCPPLKDAERLGWLVTEQLAAKASEAKVSKTTPVIACNETAAPRKEKQQQNGEPE